ncbi:NB-ARC domain-containing protein [Pantoea agglomerans]|uniref:NB-ARC domain-containing protein n=1 Tax=Enterobacter agglomerans TaxID=549 RepID=UPI002A69DA3E|nr:NB-ARC domain-containing protein [Pantoea agglomerans]MDY0900186.1 NB-ARC domain-containing protein [Pantoea agglomerans]
MDITLYRRKTAMVLHEIEYSLGNFILDEDISIEDIPQDIVKNVVARDSQRKQFSEIIKPKDIIESTYLDELFSIAIEITKNNSLNDYIQYIRDQFIINDIYNIRNVISHPNRQFIISYWFKVAAIASDPIINILKLGRIHSALISAEENNLSDPPDEWYEKTMWELPNNLPEVFEHGITGLVGRQKEQDLLIDCLKNRRVSNIAIVAPGGIGKTALALDLLSRQVKNPETKNYFDSCIFSTLKTEKLTSDGVIKLDAIESLLELKESVLLASNKIYDEAYLTFEELCNNKPEEKILLFIDNLETLLINSTKDFEDFTYDLPPAWRVLITSRISINNARIISLEPLKEKHALHLARTYLQKRNRKNLPEEVLKNLVSKCYNNPLAIRLSIDLYLAGKEIPESISVANKEIASFSYSNLIDALSDVSVNILEALFISDNNNRITLCEMLSLSLEEIVESIAQLSNTSLINRTTSGGGEIYSLSESIRELLVTTPRNIHLREKLLDDLKRRKAITKQIEHEQRQNSIPPYHWEYIPNNLNENLIPFIKDVNKSFKGMNIPSKPKAITLMNKCRDMDHLYSEISIFNRSYGRVASSLNASPIAITKFKKALQLDPNDINSSIFLAMHHHNSGDYSLAYDIYKALIDEGWCNEDEYIAEFTQRIYNGCYLALLFDLRYPAIIEQSKKWKDLKHSRGIVGVFRATALKRMAEDVIQKDPSECMSLLSRAMRTLDDVIRVDGYIRPACEQAKSVFNELAAILKIPVFKEDKDFSNEALEFIAMHLNSISAYVKIGGDDEITTLIRRLSRIDMPKNPFISISIPKYAQSDLYNPIDEEYALQKGLEIVQISNIPKSKDGKESPLYIFAKKDNKDYYLRYEFLKNGGYAEWFNLKQGDSIAIKPLKEQPKGKSLLASEIYLL